MINQYRMSRARDNRNDPTPCAVYCHGDCGLVFISVEEEGKQLMRPDHGWYCPQCCDSASWDDYCQRTNPPDEE